MLFYAILCAVVVGYVLLALTLSWERRKYRHLPQATVYDNPLVSWIAGAGLEMRRRSLRRPGISITVLCLEFREENGWSDCDVFYVPLFDRNLIVCVDPEMVGQVLTDVTTFTKPHEHTRNLSKIAGTRALGDFSIFSERGTHVWATKRRLMEPGFRRSFLKITMAGMNQVADNLIGILHENRESVIDISEEFNRSVFEAIAVCGFAWNQEKVKKEADNQLEMASIVFRTAFLTFKEHLHLFFNLPWMYRQEKETLRKLLPPGRAVIRKHLEERMKDENSSAVNDVLSYIIKANSFSEQFTIEHIVDDYVTFLLAAMETTSITLACLVFLLLRNREVYERVQEEVDTILADKTELEFDDLPKLKYMEAVIKETLRLHPPVQAVPRMCTKEGVSLKGIRIPKRATIAVAPIVHHHDTRYWEDPETFNPERFIAPTKIKPFTFIPFLAGPRNCIGKNFAMLEMKVLLSKLFREFQLVNPDPQIQNLVTLLTALTARPVDPVRVKVQPRSSTI